MNDLSRQLRNWITTRRELEPFVAESNLRWSRVAIQTSTDRVAAENAISHIYRMAQIGWPRIIWCQSPRELVLLEALHCAMRRRKVEARSEQELVTALSRAAQGRDDEAIYSSVARKMFGSESWTPNFMDKTLSFIFPRPYYLAPQHLVADEIAFELHDRYPGGFIEWAFGGSRLIVERSSMLSATWRRMVGDAIGDPRLEALWLDEDESSNSIVSMLSQISGAEGSFRITADEYIRAAAFRAWAGCIGALNDRVINILVSLEMLDEHYGVKIKSPTCQQIKEICQSVHSCLATPNYCLVSEYPVEVHMDEQGLLHCETGPAVRYSDGWSIYAIHGLTLPREVIETPEQLTVERINSEPNIEIRRAMIQHYGLGRFLTDCNAKEIHSDVYGTLYGVEVPGDEPIVFVKVKNSTASPDGTFAEYFLRVPPWTKTAHEGVAWTYRLDAERYNPSEET